MRDCKIVKFHAWQRDDTRLHEDIFISKFTSKCAVELNFYNELFLNQASVVSNEKNCSHLYDVIIVGAGMAGLGAATTIVEGGISNILILEAQNYVGGRVQSFPCNDSFVEIGAQWIHGQDDNIAYELAKEYQLLADYTSAEGEGPYLREDGSVIDLHIVKEVYDVIAEILEDCCVFADPNVQSTDIPPSVGHYLRENYWKYLDKCSDDTTDIRIMKEELYDWHLRFHVIDNSCYDLDHLSAKEWGEYKACEGQNYMNFKQGFSSLVNKIVQQLPDELVHLNCPVVEINWKPQIRLHCCDRRISHNKESDVVPSQEERKLIDIVKCDQQSDNNNCFSVGNATLPLPTKIKEKLPSEHERNCCAYEEATYISTSECPVTVTCENGSTYAAKHVIVTCSLGYLKEFYKTMFKPALPASISQGIEDMGFATINKIFLDFGKPWWDSNIKGFQIIFSDYRKVVPSREEPSSWLRDITGFDVLQNQVGVLLCWVGGVGAELMEELHEDEVGRHCTALLRKHTGNQSIPLPQKVIRSRWHSNPFVRGGYSNTTSTCDKSGCNPSSLATPVWTNINCSDSRMEREHPAILIAGEAVHRQYFSTTHGAYQSGVEQANVILDYRSKFGSL